MEFILVCRTLYYKGYAPPDFIDDKTSELVIEGTKLLKTYGVDEFGGHLLEGSYYIYLWSAMIILKYGDPNPSQRKRCIDKIAINIPDHVNEARLAAWLEEYEKG